MCALQTGKAVRFSVCAATVSRSCGSLPFTLRNGSGSRAGDFTAGFPSRRRPRLHQRVGAPRGPAFLSPIRWTICERSSGVPQSTQSASNRLTCKRTPPCSTTAIASSTGRTQSVSNRSAATPAQHPSRPKGNLHQPISHESNMRSGWLLSAAATAGLIVEDRRIANSFETAVVRLRWGERISQIGASYTLVPLVAGYYGFGVLTDHAKGARDRRPRHRVLLDSLIVAGVLKEVFRRNRPTKTDLAIFGAAETRSFGPRPSRCGPSHRW